MKFKSQILSLKVSTNDVEELGGWKTITANQREM